MSVALLRSSTCAEEAQHQLSVLALWLWEQGLDFVLNAMVSAESRVGTVHVAFNWTFRWESEERDQCRGHRCGAHHVQKRLRTIFLSWLFSCGSKAWTFVLNAMGSAQPRVGTVHVAFNCTFRWESEERDKCRWHRCGAHHVQKRPSTSFQSWLFGCGSRAKMFVLNATGSAQL